MVWIDHNNRTILWAVAQPPSGLINETSESPSRGIYVFGVDSFISQDLFFSSIFRRSIGGAAEDFLLGLITVLLIAVLSEIVQSILLQTKRTEGNASARGQSTRMVRTFALDVSISVDDFFHTRYLYRAVSSCYKTIRSRTRRLFLKTSFATIVAAVITLTIFAVDMFTVYLTQPIVINSEKYDYNIAAIQPSVTDRRSSRLVHRISRDRSCVTPLVKFQLDQYVRDFSFSACLMYDEQNAHNNINETVEMVQVGSWYHRYGSDHEVKFGRARIAVSSRAFLYTRCGEASWRILYETRDTADMVRAKFIQQLFIHSVIEENCNKEYETRTCGDFLDELKSVSEQKQKEISVAEKVQNVTGLVTTFNVSIREPWRNIDDGFYALTTTSILEERRGPALYEHFDDGNVADGIFGLINERGRLAGLVTFCILFATSFVLLLVLRFLLWPTSLAEMAVLKQRRRIAMEKRSMCDKAVVSSDGEDSSIRYSEIDYEQDTQAAKAAAAKYQFGAIGLPH